MPLRAPRGRFSYAYKGTSVIVEHLYAEKSRVIRSAEGAQAVLIEGEPWMNKDELRGWISDEGKYFSEDSIRDLLNSLSSTTASEILGVDLVEVWDSLTLAQQAEMASKLMYIDWETWFEEFGSGSQYEVQGSIDNQTAMFLDLLEQFGDIKSDLL